MWLFTGDDVTVENVELSGARSQHENGARIRHIGAGLTLRHIYLHDNENGLLTGNRFPDTNEILFEYSDFAKQRDNRGYAHNILVGCSMGLKIKYSCWHGSRRRHLVKSKARENVIASNRPVGGAPVAMIDGSGQMLAKLTLPEYGMTDPRHHDCSFLLGGRSD